MAAQPWSAKRRRQFAHIKEGLVERGDSDDLAVLTRLVGDADRRPASERRVTPMMVVGVEESVKGPGSLDV
jgi:hypothetical protein